MQINTYWTAVVGKIIFKLRGVVEDRILMLFHNPCRGVGFGDVRAMELRQVDRRGTYEMAPGSRIQ
jgi:hypothetical protein